MSKMGKTEAFQLAYYEATVAARRAVHEQTVDAKKAYFHSKVVLEKRWRELQKVRPGLNILDALKVAPSPESP